MARLDLEWEIQPFNDLAACTISADKILCAYLVLQLRKLVGNCGGNQAINALFKRLQFSIEPSLESVLGSMPNQNWL
jgi:hypothetical protein